MSEKRFDAIEAKLDAHDAKLDAHSAKLDAHGAKLDAHSAKLDAHSAKLDAHGARLDAHEAKLDSLATGQDEIRFHLIRVDKRLDRLEVGQESLSDQVRQVAEGHAATQAAIARSTERVIGHIDKKIAPLEAAVRALFRAQ